MLTILAAEMAASLTACGGSSDKGAATTAAAAGGSDTKTEALAAIWLFWPLISLPFPLECAFHPLRLRSPVCALLH